MLNSYKLIEKGKNIYQTKIILTLNWKKHMHLHENKDLKP